MTNTGPDYATGWQPEPDYDLVYPRIARTLERLCRECGWQNVLGVFSCDMPSHRRRERHEAEAKARARQRKGRLP
jgi:hypothetical protein